MRRLDVLAVVVALLAPGAAQPEMPVFPEFAEPEFYGRVVLDNFATKSGVPAVTFDHWRHRAIFTCRVCHADIAFAMKAGETRVSAATNRSGLHCGACHNGKTIDGTAVFTSCSEASTLDPSGSCARCHTGSGHRPRARYRAFTAKLPKDRSGLVDWEIAENRGAVKPIDFVEGVSVGTPSMKIDKDVPIAAIGTWLGNVTFSHKKHAVWNGCEVCHPEIFPVTKRGSAKYDMEAIRKGQYCGVCHNTVAFPVAFCQRCHEDRVRTPMR